MKESNRRLLTPALTVLGCLVLLLVVIGLASRSGSSDDSAAIGFPIVLAGLAVLAVVFAFVWKAVSKGKSSSGQR
jgi:hypothetical protein